MLVRLFFNVTIVGRNVSIIITYSILTLVNTPGIITSFRICDVFHNHYIYKLEINILVNFLFEKHMV